MPSGCFVGRMETSPALRILSADFAPAAPHSGALREAVALGNVCDNPLVPDDEVEADVATRAPHAL